MNKVLEALQFRHACKQFDSKRKISDDTLSEILECGRLSPSSFGMEPWKFAVVQSEDLRKELRTACWDQPQITESSVAVVILTDPTVVEPGNEYVNDKFARRKLPDDAREAYLKRYKSHMESEVEPVMGYYAWASKQCYLALANMMTGAAAVGIDSCPIEGFNKKEVERVLELEDSNWEVVVVFTMGYRKGEQTERLRASFNEIIEFR